MIFLSITNNLGGGNPTLHKTFNLEVAHDTNPVHLIMRPTLQELIETGHDIRVYFEVSHFELYDYIEDAFIDIYVDKIINDLPTLTRLLHGHDVSIISDNNRIRIRIYEKPFE